MRIFTLLETTTHQKHRHHHHQQQQQQQKQRPKPRVLIIIIIRFLISALSDLRVVNITKLLNFVHSRRRSKTCSLSSGTESRQQQHVLSPEYSFAHCIFCDSLWLLMVYAEHIISPSLSIVCVVWCEYAAHSAHIRVLCTTVWLKYIHPFDTEHTNNSPRTNLQHLRCICWSLMRIK